MKKEDLLKKKLIDAPGVYFFLGSKKEILYIGKATSLKNRITSYFSNDIAMKRSPLIEQMVDEAKTIDVSVTDSVLEALILESNLIRTHRPKFNTISKDDKSYNHLIITNEVLPRVLIVRGKDITEKFSDTDIKYHFGPFTSATLFRDALRIIRKLFKFYDTKNPVGNEKSKFTKGKIDFNRQIGLYPESTDKIAYTKTIRHIRLFFEGKKLQIINELRKEMMQHAKAERFEEASICKRKIFALEHIQDISLLKADLRTHRDNTRTRIEAYDVAHLFGDDMVGVMTVVDGGEPKKSEYRKFKITSVTKSNDTAALREMLERRFAHKEWAYPQIVVVDGSTAQKRVAEKVLSDRNLSIPVVAVVKDDKHNPTRLIGAKKLIEDFKLEILHANAESHRFATTYHKEKRRKRVRS